MSTTQPRFTPTGRPAPPDDPRDVFGHLVERNGDVCRRCYTLLKERQPLDWRIGSDLPDNFRFVEQVEDGRLGAFVEGAKLEHRHEDAYPPEERTDSGTNSCRCGAIDTHRTPDTRSKREAVEAAVGISTVLTEYDVHHDWVFLVERVKKLKSKPAFAGNDFKTFRLATAEAVRVARSGSPTP